MLILSSEILAQVSIVEALRPVAHLISGVVGLLILFISVLMQIASFGLGVEVIGSMFWAGFILIAFDLGIQGFINWLANIGSLSLESAIRDLVILVIGAGVGYAIKSDLLAWFIGLGILTFTIFLWGLPGLVERCAGYCFFLKYL
jgi:hypothetical protein